MIANEDTRYEAEQILRSFVNKILFPWFHKNTTPEYPILELIGGMYVNG